MPELMCSFAPSPRAKDFMAGDGPVLPPGNKRIIAWKACIWATWASPTPTWAMPRRPSSTTSRRWPSPARSATGGAKGNDLGNLGIAYADLGEARRAIEYYEQALAIAREIGDRRGEGNAPGQPGHCLRRPGRDTPGHRVLRAGAGHRPRDRRPPGRRALPWATWAAPTPTWARPAGPSSTTSRRWPSPARSATGAARATRLGNLGNAYADLGETRQAIEYYEQALAIAREIGDRRGEGSALGNLGIAYADLGEAAPGHRVLRAGAGHRPRDRRPAGRRSRSGQPGHRLRRPGRGPQGHRVLRAGAGHRPRDRRPAGRRATPWATWASPTIAWAKSTRLWTIINSYSRSLTK